MRKLHPDAYWSSKVQHQMHEDQKLMGDVLFGLALLKFHIDYLNLK